MDFADACRKARFRHRRRFTHGRVWRWLKRQPEPVRVADGVAALGLTARSVGNALRALRKRGIASCTARMWTPVLPGMAFKQEKLWRWMKRQNRPLSNVEMREYLGVSVCAVTSLLKRMKREGKVVMVKGGGKHARWVAAGDLPPDCKWGLAPGSEIGRAKGVEVWRHALTQANRARGEPTSFSLTTNPVNGVSFLRERAPAKSVQIPTLAQLLGIKDAA